MKFETWFKQQFGKLPMSPKKYNKIFGQCAIAETRFGYLQQELAEDKLLVEKWTAALYAKQAFEQSKEAP